MLKNTNNQAQLYPLTSAQKDNENLMKDLQWICVEDEKDLDLYGNQHASKGRQIVVELTRCTTSSQCLDVARQNTFLKGRWLVLATNSINFDANGFEEDAIR